MNNISNIVVYNDGELELKVSVGKDTIWLNTDEIAYIFNVNRPAIVKHIGNIYKDEELDKYSTCSILEQVAKDGKIRKMNFYNLDIIISVGYRVNSKKATKFRQWATKVLKSYIQNSYVINADKITNERFVSLENIDNYIDDTTLTLFSKIPNIKVAIYTNIISKQLKQDFEKYSKQYDNITLKTFKDSHDRFLILDKKEIYHIGASIKDLGKKWFAFSKIDISANDLISKLV